VLVRFLVESNHPHASERQQRMHVSLDSVASKDAAIHAPTFSSNVEETLKPWPKRNITQQDANFGGSRNRTRIQGGGELEALAEVKQAADAVKHALRRRADSGGQQIRLWIGEQHTLSEKGGDVRRSSSNATKHAGTHANPLNTFNRFLRRRWREQTQATMFVWNKQLNVLLTFRRLLRRRQEKWRRRHNKRANHEAN